jgi:hypothetical protein
MHFMWTCLHVYMNHYIYNILPCRWAIFALPASMYGQANMTANTCKAVHKPWYSLGICIYPLRRIGMIYKGCHNYIQTKTTVVQLCPPPTVQWIVRLTQFPLRRSPNPAIRSSPHISSQIVVSTPPCQSNFTLLPNRDMKHTVPSWHMLKVFPPRQATFLILCWRWPWARLPNSKATADEF